MATMTHRGHLPPVRFFGIVGAPFVLSGRIAANEFAGMIRIVWANSGE
jgi:hypothetical protein